MGLGLAIATSLHAAPLKVHGSATVFDMLTGSRKAEIEKEAGLSLEVLSLGSGKGIESLVAGNCDVAMSASPLALFAGSAWAQPTVSLRADEWYPFNRNPTDAKPGYVVELLPAVFAQGGGQRDHQVRPCSTTRPPAWARSAAIDSSPR